jgi:hypothetical protein
MESVVVPDTETGAPNDFVKATCASSLRDEIFGAFPIICTETLLISKPFFTTKSRTCVIISLPDIPAISGLSTPKKLPTSPNWHADKTASQIACAAASPSECPTSFFVSGQTKPASASGPLSPNW